MEPEPGAPAPTPTPEDGNQEPKVTIPQKEYEDLSHKASISSQNFERMKKAEKELEDLRASQVPYQPPTDADANRIAALEKEISDLRDRDTVRELQDANPLLKESWSEFETFYQDPANAAMDLRTAARVFMAEKGLGPAPRKGLERPTGGPRVPTPTGMTAEDVTKLRTQNPKKYYDMVRKGQIQIAE